MRISDWSSDVCSSDLLRESSEGTEWSGLVDGRQRTAGRQGSHDREKATEGRIVGFRCPDDREGQDIVRISDCLDRKSVVSGKSVSVRVDLGGCRSIKKK